LFLVSLIVCCPESIHFRAFDSRCQATACISWLSDVVTWILHAPFGPS
jgi:hypothetical protein